MKTKTVECRELLIETIREHLLNSNRFSVEKPSIAELEEILDKRGSGAICLNPDGSIGTKEIKTSGSLADAILSVFKLSLKRKKEE